jgi:hypothetical protein
LVGKRKAATARSGEGGPRLPSIRKHHQPCGLSAIFAEIGATRQSLDTHVVQQKGKMSDAQGPLSECVRGRSACKFFAVFSGARQLKTDKGGR